MHHMPNFVHASHVVPFSSLLVHSKPCDSLLSMRKSVPNISMYKHPDHRHLMPTLSAGLSVPNVIRPGGVVESDRLPSNQRKLVMEAIDAFDRRVTVGEVASRAGLKLLEAQRALQALAADTDGFLEVSEDGDILYIFLKDYHSKLIAKSFMMKIEPLVDNVKLGVGYLIRVSFGTALIGSVLLVYTTIIALLSSTREEDEDKRHRRRNNVNFSFYITPDMFWNWNSLYFRRRPHKRTGKGIMRFTESVFSFVFGDGNPNEGIEEERWKLIGNYITAKGGVVVAEELAPFLDVQPSKISTNDESYVLPVLLRFDGSPIIDEEGNILYQLSSLQHTARAEVGRKWFTNGRTTGLFSGEQRLLKERKWNFSETDATERATVLGLGGLNLFGVIVLSVLLRDLLGRPSGFIKFVAKIFPLLQLYATSFFAIPLIRWLVLCKRNAGVEKRNKAREECARALDFPNRMLQKKVQNARDMAGKRIIGRDRPVYRTDKDLIEQDIDVRDWNEKFRNTD